MDKDKSIEVNCEEDRTFKGINPDNYVCGTIVNINDEAFKVVRGINFKKYFEAGHSLNEPSVYDPVADRTEELTNYILKQQFS